MWRRFLTRVRALRSPLRSGEDVVLASVGRDLCDAFFSGHSRKQWELGLAELSPGVAARVPTRCNGDERYFSDRWQCMSAAGYSTLFAQRLTHPGITLRLHTGFDAVRGQGLAPRITDTGAIDAYFGHCLGQLPYRSLRFAHQHLAGVAQFQAVDTVNCPNTEACTRITEFKHLTGQQVAGTLHRAGISTSPRQA